MDIKLFNDIKFDTNADKIRILLNLHKDFRKIKNLIETRLTSNEELKNKKFEIAIAPEETSSESKKKPGLSKVKIS